MAVLLVIFGGALSYIGESGLPGYVMTLAGLAILLLTPRARLYTSDRRINLLAGSYFGVSCLSVAANMDIWRLDMAQTLLYPITFYVVATNWQKFARPGRLATFAILSLFVLNGAAALLVSFFGIDVPFAGPTFDNRYIFLTDLRSSSGFMWNVNYYSACQAAGFWLLFLIGRTQNVRSAAFNLAVGFVGASILIGSSRGVLAAFIISLLVYGASRTPKRYLPLSAVGVAAALWLVLGGGLSLDLDLIRRGLRIERGLNSRDSIWLAAWEVIKSHPLFGIASPSHLRLELLLAGSPVTALQNSYLLTAARIGALGLVLTISVFGFALRRAWRAIRSSAMVACAVAGLTLILTDSLARSYSLGGIGLVPVCLSIFVGLLLAAPNLRGCPRDASDSSSAALRKPLRAAPLNREPAFLQMRKR